MAGLPQFLISTQTDPYWEIPFYDAAGKPLSVEGRTFEAWIAPATSKTGVGEPVAPIKVLTFQDGLTLVPPTDGSGDQTVRNTFVHQVSRAFAQTNFPRGELTADILEVVNGARRLLVPVRLRYDDPAAIRDFVADRAGVTFGGGRQPIVTPVAVAGQAGRRGAGFLIGSLPPQPSDGENGDHWIVERVGQSGLLYGPKEDGEWPAQPSSALGVGGVADVPGLRGELDELVPRRTGTLSVKGNLERSTGAAKDVAVTDLGAAIGLDIARQQIPETFIPVRSFVAAGFHTPGDMGRGAIYARGTSAGPLAIQDKGGTWFNLVVGDVIVAGHLGCRPVFLRSGCSIAAGSRQMLVNSGTQWRVGDRVLVQGAGANPKAFSKTFQVNGPPARSGPIFFGADGYLFNANSGDGGVTFLTTDTAEQCAASIRAGSWAGWTVTGTGRQATFTCNQARGSIGVRFSDIYGNALPITETLNQEGAGDFIARVVSIVGDTLTLDRDAVTAITGSLCYLEHGSQIREFMDAVPGKTLQLQAGAYLFFRGLKHTKEGTGAIGAGLQNTIIYAVTAAEDLTEWELPTAEVGFFAPKFQDLTIDMMEARRHGATFRRLWDGASVRNVAIINVAAEYSGWRVMRHSTQAPSQSVNDQAVISQSLNADNIHVERASNSSGLYPVPVTYMEYVQEGSLTNFKSIVRGDSNTSQNTVACQWEACRGLVAGAGTSFALAGTGLKVTSITGQSEGCSVAGATFETNGKSVDFAGGTYDIRTFDIVAPRYIGAGGDIVANRLSSGLIMARDRFLRLTAGARNVRYLSDDPSKVIDEVAANNNVDLSSYHYGRTKELPVDLTLRKALATLLLRTPGGNAFYRLQMSATDSVNYGLFFQSSQDGVSWTTAMSLNPDGSLSLNIPFVGFRQLVSGPPDSGGSGSRALIVNN